MGNTAIAVTLDGTDGPGSAGGTQPTNPTYQPSTQAWLEYLNKHPLLRELLSWIVEPLKLDCEPGFVAAIEYDRCQATSPVCASGYSLDPASAWCLSPAISTTQAPTVQIVAAPVPVYLAAAQLQGTEEYGYCQTQTGLIAGFTADCAGLGGSVAQILGYAARIPLPGIMDYALSKLWPDWPGYGSLSDILTQYNCSEPGSWSYQRGICGYQPDCSPGVLDTAAGICWTDFKEIQCPAGYYPSGSLCVKSTCNRPATRMPTDPARFKETVAELRSAINVMRLDAGLSATAWAAPVAVVDHNSSTQLWSELRSGIAEVYSVCGQQPPSWSAPATGRLSREIIDELSTAIQSAK